jgi:hypothetical protein
MVSARRRLIFKECQRPGFADVAMYAKPVGKQRIRGLSIRFAEAAIRHFTNVLTQVAVVFDDERRRILHVSVIDLETERDLRRGRHARRSNGSSRARKTGTACIAGDGETDANAKAKGSRTFAPRVLGPRKQSTTCQPDEGWMILSHSTIARGK